MNNIELMKKQILLLETMLNSVGTYIFGKDTHGCYVYANTKVLELFEKPLEEVIGKDDSHFFDLELSTQLKENDQKVLSEGVSIEKEETNVVKATKETRIYRSVKSPIFDSDGNIIGICGVSTDITEEVRLQKLVKQQKTLLDTVLNNIDAYIYMKNEQREFLYVNEKTADMFGYPVEEIVGRKETELLPVEVAEHFHQSDSKVFATKEKQVIDEEVLTPQGEKLHYLSVKVPFQQESGEPALIGFSSDVTELYRLKEEFRQQANTDYLTQLYNRRYFVLQAEKEFSRAQRYHSSLSLLSLDIDHFKRINDQYGHPVGDKVLIKLAERLSTIIRKEDTLARIGGEEFSILLPETSIEVAFTLAERIRKTQSESIIIDDWHDEISITVSVGVSNLIEGDENFDQLFKRADEALYQAKSIGRDKVIKIT